MPNLFAEPPKKYGSPFTESHLRRIVDAIIHAWEDVDQVTYDRLDPFEPKMFNDEDKISSRIKDILCRYLTSEQFDWFSVNMFQHPTRDEKYVSNTGKEDKMPDLTFKLVGNLGSGFSHDQHALFIECKVVRKNGGQQNVKNYVHKGISRFVEGTYAVDSDIAMMVAYSTDGFFPPKEIQKHFTQCSLSDCPKPSSITGWELSEIGKDKPFVSAFQSNHIRKSGRSIRVMHIWLQKNRSDVLLQH